MNAQPSQPVVALAPPEWFLAEAFALSIEFEPGDVDRLGLFLALLLEANTHFNLTGITKPDEAWRRHILDSLTLLPLIASAEARTVVDVGSGGGLPGIPLAIALPGVAFTLVEATGKKARFLQQTARQLNLSNVTVVNERAETVGRDRENHREHYDVAIARAVGPLRVLIELTVPLVRVGGIVLAMKGAKASDEIADSKIALHKLHAHITETLTNPLGTIVVIAKQRITPKMYPRAPGEPKRDPLK